MCQRRPSSSNRCRYHNSTRIPPRPLHTLNLHPTASLHRTADTSPHTISNSRTWLCPWSRRFFQPANLCSLTINSPARPPWQTGTARVTRAIYNPPSSLPSLVCLFRSPRYPVHQKQGGLTSIVVPCSRCVRSHMITLLRSNRTVLHRSAVIAWTARIPPASRSRFILRVQCICSFVNPVVSIGTLSPLRTLKRACLSLSILHSPL